MRSSSTKLVAIDPSVKSLGIACMCEGVYEQASRLRLGDTGHAFSRALAMARAVRELLEFFADDPPSSLTVVIELPDNWGSGKGLHARRSGTAQSLYFTVGCIASQVSQCSQVHEFWGATAPVWKGNAPKEIMEKRAKQLYDIDYPSHDVAEAVCLLHRFRESQQRSQLGKWVNLSERTDLVVLD